MKEVVLDTETTGISIKDGHRLVEIGCIELENLIPTKNKFHCYLNPERKVSEKALQVHGYTDEFLATQKKFLEVVEQFLEFIKGKRLIIHNAEFDLSHLNNELAILGKKKISNQIIDTLTLARDKFPGSPVSLDALCKRYRIDNSKRTQHTALIDCDLLAKVYINLIDQKEPTLNFQNQNEENKEKSAFNVAYFKKVIKPSLEELKKHKEYLKNNLKKITLIKFLIVKFLKINFFFKFYTRVSRVMKKI
jgi:DNA polymerase-3 subunit epsilon